MMAFAYDAALRREELCGLMTGDIDPAHRLIRIRAETTKNMQERIVPYSLVTSQLYAAYLQERRSLGNQRGLLFLSYSPRNRGKPITIWAWSKVIQNLAQRAEVPELSTHTFRHLCLTDLARAQWDIHEIARFAGHRSLESTMRYIHLSGRDLSEKIARSMTSLHAWRLQMIEEVLQ
jgi:integrase/recombinase XerD